MMTVHCWRPLGNWKLCGAWMGLVLELAPAAVGEIGWVIKSDSDILKMISLSHTFYLSIYQTDGLEEAILRLLK